MVMSPTTRSGSREAHTDDGYGFVGAAVATSQKVSPIGMLGRRRSKRNVRPRPLTLTNFSERLIRVREAPILKQQGRQIRHEIPRRSSGFSNRRSSSKFPCDICPFVTKYRSNLKVHMRVHSDDRAFPCPICEHASKHKQHCYTHLRIHTGEAPFFCGTCGKEFAQQASRDHHLRGGCRANESACCDEQTIEEEYRNRPLDYTNETWRLREALRCQICGTKYQSLADVMDCLRQKHKMVRCYLCFKTFSSTKALFMHFVQAHERLDDNKVKCHFCDAAFPAPRISLHVIETHLVGLINRENAVVSPRSSIQTRAAKPYQIARRMLRSHVKHQFNLTTGNSPSAPTKEPERPGQAPQYVVPVVPVEETMEEDLAEPQEAEQSLLLGIELVSEEDINGTKRPPLEQLPEDVWHLVFDKVETSRNLYSCFQTCTVFETMLKPQSYKFLFPLVLPILVNQQEFIEDAENVCLPSRLVCRRWRNGVDAYTPSVSLNPDEAVILPYIFSESTQLESFRQLMSNRPQSGNPFISRSVKLTRANYDDDFQVIEDIREVDPEERIRVEVEFWNTARRLLEAFGSDIWHLELCATSELLPISNFYEYLLDFVTLTPNLRSLLISHDADYNNPYDLRIRTPPQLLCHLVRLEVNHIPRKALQNVLRLCDPKKLEKIKLSTKYDCLDVAASLSNLTWFRMTLHRSEALNAFQFASWPLESAYLKVKLYHKADQMIGIKFGRLFEAISSFEGTLRNLKLDLHGDAELSPFGSFCDRNARLELPHLTNLHVYATGLTGGIFSVDFILGLPNLTELELYLTTNCLNSLTTVGSKGNSMIGCIKLSAYADRMTESNVWDHLPQLERLKISDDVDNCFLYVFQNGVPLKVGTAEGVDPPQVVRRRRPFRPIQVPQLILRQYF